MKAILISFALVALFLVSCSSPAPSGSKNFQEAYKMLTERTKAIENSQTCEEFISLTEPMEEYDLLYDKLSLEEQAKLNAPTADLMKAIFEKDNELGCIPFDDGEEIEAESMAKEEE